MNKQRELLEGIIIDTLVNIATNGEACFSDLTKKSQQAMKGKAYFLTQAILSAGFVHKDSLSEEKIENILNDIYVRIPVKGTRITRLQASAIAKGDVYE